MKSLPACSLLFFIFSIVPATAFSSTIRVPEDYPTIQGAIDASLDGDTVLVSDGTYSGEGNRDIDSSGRAVVLMSVSVPGYTTIDCGGGPDDQHRGFVFTSSEDSRRRCHLLHACKSP